MKSVKHMIFDAKDIASINVCKETEVVEYLDETGRVIRGVPFECSQLMDFGKYTCVIQYCKNVDNFNIVAVNPEIETKINATVTTDALNAVFNEYHLSDRLPHFDDLFHLAGNMETDSNIEFGMF